MSSEGQEGVKKQGGFWSAVQQRDMVFFVSVMYSCIHMPVNTCELVIVCVCALLLALSGRDD